MTDNNSTALKIRNVDINICETEFANMRQNFDDSMRQIDQDMQRFLSGSSVDMATIPMIEHNQAGNEPSSSPSTDSEQNISNWCNSSIIQTDENNNPSIRMRFDLHEFNPEDIQVTTNNGKIVVYAKHEETAGNRTTFSEFRREITLPQGISENELETTLSADGVLTVCGTMTKENNGSGVDGSSDQTDIDINMSIKVRK